MLAQTEMSVVFVLGEKISRGALAITLRREKTAKASAMLEYP